jgi:hypothetical protein
MSLLAGFYEAQLAFFHTCVGVYSRSDIASRVRKLSLSQTPCCQEDKCFIPTAQLPAEVRLNSDAGIESCSRMPYPESCSQNCTSQLQFSPDNLSEFVEKHEGKKCASCGTNLTGEEWYKSRLTAHTRIRERSPLPAARITTKALPVCFTCYQAFGAE